MKLRFKFILFSVFLMVILIAGLVYYLNFYFKDYFKNHTFDNFQILAEMSESSYFSFIKTLGGRTVDWSSDGYIRNTVEEILKTPVKDREPLIKALNSYLKNEKIIYDSDVLIIDILDKDGIVLASSKEERVGVDEKKEELEFGKVRFIEAIQANFGEFFVVPVIIEEDEHTDPMIHITTRIFSKKTYSTDQLIPLDAVMLIHFINVDKLRNVLIGNFQLEGDKITNKELTEYYKTADIYLVNKDRLMITPSRFSEGTILTQNVDTEPVRACLERGEEIKSEYLDYRGVSVFGASICLKKNNLMLVLEAESQEVLAPLKNISQYLILVGGVAIILIIAGIILLSNWLLRGLGVIIGVAEKITKGDISERAKINSKDEIGYLAKVFNQMIDNIQKEDKFMLLLRDIAMGANETNDINKAYQIIIDKICFYKNWPIGHVYILENNGSGALVSAKIWHLSDPEKFKIFKEVTEKTSFKKGVGLPGRILESKNPIWISDITKDSNFPRTKLIENINIGAAFGFPVVSEDGNVSAVFEFFSAEPEEMKSGFLKIIENINLQINRVMERIAFKEQLEKKVKERTTELMELKVGLEKTVSRRTVDLEKKLDELEKFKKMTIDRELKMIELKKEIEALKNKELKL